ncbi:UNVERIFIED_CONTAM: hypothetical protein H355_003493, partial [Colinus virginianus]
MNEQEPAVFRHAPRRSDTANEKPRGTAVLDRASFEYLFEQGKFDFINDVASLTDFRTETEVQRFKNESLGMAVLHLAHIALRSGRCLQDVARKYSFQECIPRSFRHQIQRNSAVTRFRMRNVFRSFQECIPRSFRHQIQRNSAVTRFRMRNVFRRFVRRFQQHTVGAGKLAEQDVMFKYVATLEQLAPRFGTELFPALSLDVCNEGEKGRPYSDGGHVPAQRGDAPLAEDGPVSHEVLVTGTTGIQWRPVPNESVEVISHRGYFGRRSRRKEPEPRAPPQPTEPPWVHFCDFREITHVVIRDRRVSVHRQDNKCLVSAVGPGGRGGTERAFWGGDRVDVGCGKDQEKGTPLSAELGKRLFLLPAEISDLLITTQKVKDGEKQILNLTQLSFHQIRKDEITQNNNNDGREMHVVLKVLDPSHRDVALAFFETASLMSQVSHVHLAFVHGVCVRGSESDAAGPDADEAEYFSTEQNNNNDGREMHVVLKVLDPSHRDVALAFFETASLMSQVSHVHLAFVHGVCVRGSEKRFYEKKHRLPEPSCQDLAALIQQCLSYTPAERPSFRTVLRDLTQLQPHNLVDVSSVNPDFPVSDPTVFQKRYLKKIRELGEGHFGKVGLYCYDPTNDGTGEMVAVKSLKADCSPQLLASWRKEISILKTLYHENIVKYKGCCSEQDLVDVSSVNPDFPVSDPTVFQKRYLKKIRELGEGHFGKVGLYCYDPTNDGTGEMVAVKSLKADCSPQLLASWRKEISILKTLYHENIVKYKGCCSEQ